MLIKHVFALASNVFSTRFRFCNRCLCSVIAFIPYRETFSLGKTVSTFGSNVFAYKARFRLSEQRFRWINAISTLRPTFALGKRVFDDTSDVFDRKTRFHLCERRFTLDKPVFLFKCDVQASYTRFCPCERSLRSVNAITSLEAMISLGKSIFAIRKCGFTLASDVFTR